MMLYVFHVDTGTMKTFDMRLVSESVDQLKKAVETSTGIAVDKQVLLISGGECLDGAKSIGSYAAGTDTNPIFLFSKAMLETNQPVAPPSEIDSDDDDTAERIREAMELPASFNTVHRRAQLAQQLHERARDQHAVCERLVHDQHLQQQGWSAVVANLEDLAAEFRHRTEAFGSQFQSYLKDRETFQSFVFSFQEDLQRLRKIPLLPVLEEMEEKNAEDEDEEEEESSSGETSETKTLYDWLTTSGALMEQLLEQCHRGLEMFNEESCQSVEAEIKETLANSDNSQMKEVKGLGERLSGLETLMREAKKKVQEQNENAKSFVNNQSRVSNLMDASILPDLCASHRKQLVQMAANHQQLCDIRRRCAKAKEELGANLYHRLKWVMFIENKIFNIDQRVVFFHDGLTRLRRNLEVVQQIHVAPALYLCAVAEVVRRRAFSQSFLAWSSDLACRMLAVYNDEVSRRKDFNQQFDGHFLASLFAGMGDMPPDFATQAPRSFDSRLPLITSQDVERLRRLLPELAEHLDVAVADEPGADVLTMKVSSCCVGAVQRVVVVNKNNSAGGGCESEGTDTEEFEKVGRHSPKTAAVEDSLHVTRAEHDKLKTTIEALLRIARNAIAQLKAEMNHLKSAFLSNISELEQDYCKLVQSYSLSVEENQRIKDENEIKSGNLEAEVGSLRNICRDKDGELNNLRVANIVLEQKVQKSYEEINELRGCVHRLKEEKMVETKKYEEIIKEKDVEKEKLVKETIEKLNREHRAEVDNIRTRFKLMTMERTPSDSSLEKIGDFSLLPNHESILQQMNETFEINRDLAVKVAVEKENERMMTVLNERLGELTRKHEEDKMRIIEDVARSVGEEKDKQIDVLMEREKNLSLEVAKHKGTLQQLAEDDDDNNKEREELLEELTKENRQLKTELEALRKQQLASESVMAASTAEISVVTSSTALLEDSMAASTAETSATMMMSSSSRRSKAYGNRLPVGSTADIYWDQVYHNYRIDVDGKLYFLHPDNYAALELRVVDGVPNRRKAKGEVVDKEYCVSRKDANRYNVPKGKKFFRVKVKPLATMVGFLQPEEMIPESVEKSSFQDSGCVEGQVIEEAAVAIEEELVDEGKPEEGVADDEDDNEEKEQQEEEGRSGRPNWLGMMVSRMFSHGDEA